MANKYDNCPKCGKNGLGLSAAMFAWLATPAGFMESLSRRQTVENLWSKIEKVKDLRWLAVLPIFLMLIYCHKFSAIVNFFLVMSSYFIFYITEERRQSDIRRVIDNFFPKTEHEWRKAIFATKVSSRGLFCNICGLCWDKHSGKSLAVYREEDDYQLRPTGRISVD